MAYSGVSASGTAFFAYILCNEPQVKMLKADIASRTPRSVLEYGELLFIDSTSATPTAEAAEFLQSWCAENQGDLIN